MAPDLVIAVAPAVTTQAATSVNAVTATGNGDITALGSPSPTAHGFVWNTTGSPTLADSFTDAGAASTTGAFTGLLTGLAGATTYYARAYAANALDTVYGNEVSFTTSATERQALIAFYNSTNGDAWTTNRGWKTPPLHTDGFAMPGTEGTWYGITSNGGNITAITLAANNLVGSLPPAIGDLPYLTVLDLRSNRLVGSLPPSMGNLTDLIRLLLTANQLTGSLPTELGDLTKLTALDLCNNQFSGPLPASLGNLTDLQYASLYTNHLSGSLPSELGNLVNLKTLDLHDNQFSGLLPASLGNLTALETLVMHSNQLSGAIPEEWGNLSSLVFLRIANNQLNGPIPASFGNLSRLTDLIAGNNNLNGSLPPELGSLSKLVNLDLRFNSLTGTIPVSFAGLTALKTLLLEFNELNGSIPPELGSLTALRQLLLHGNQLSGGIPPELGDLANLQYLYIHLNELSGPIPTTLGNLHSLKYLHLYSNNLSGSIPPELGALTQLVDLSIYDNLLEGTIPAELGNLTQLTILRIYGNRLAGPIPSSLANLTALNPASTSLAYNALYASDEALITFLNTKDPDWAATQTVAPSNVVATARDGGAILISWIPIAYSGNSGHYEIYSSQTASGPYTLAGTTSDKSSSSFKVTGLTPGETYYFVVQTLTEAHSANQNVVESGLSVEVSAIAWLQINVHISGAVMVGESPLPGVVISGLPGNPVTNGSGVYDVVVPAGWSGTATPTLAGYAFNPAFMPYPSVIADQLNRDYSATVIVPTITVVSPNGGEAWAAGSAHNITWMQTGLTGSVTIDLYKSGVYQRTLGTAASTDGTLSWAIGDTPGTDYRVLVWQSGISDESNADFAIMSASPSRKVDFNGDGREDILWRYYGEGGYNRAWFLGNTVGAGLPLTAVSTPMEAGLTGGRRAGNRVMATSSGNLRDMGVISDPRKGALQRVPRNVMGDSNRRTPGPASFDDPRKAGGKVVRSSLMSTADPREVIVVCDSEAPRDASGGVTAAPSLLGGADVLPVGDLNWQIVGTGDFNNDDHIDILWRNMATGSDVVWFMNGTEWTGSAELLPVTDLSWQIVGTGDFNKDTHVDILWRNIASGSNVVWYMNETEWIGSALLLGVSDPNWRVVGTGDFNNDTSIDILWRYEGAGGFNVVWYMQEAAWIGSAELIPVEDTTWRIVGTGDYNNDGNVDILWRYDGAGGHNVIWCMNGVNWAESAELPPVPDLTWKIVNH
ncbi:MAG: hypothetical protein C3F08_07650 [Candidatus Methylomirabilota bacterium]|nr:MAG: hypothetical protein C3F08_07650 [candidate division NC10 bacterium]